MLIGADTGNWERIGRHPYLRKPFPQPGELRFNAMESEPGGEGETKGIGEALVLEDQRNENTVLPEKVVYNACSCSLMFARSCLGSVTTALLTSPG